ncbi:hypothetical protein K3553_08465 [Leisingera aquaemixtae]|uniref:hypothetical protein n=1 Tax=Leisingera aquaemixtae TaxID=1396826 RepID=UPI0021A3BF41|nr:hypothetical protein [Leisingera aquaemixtae]UWQ26484.1 hypothetical protein K3553_08465 [Leisingera aquaemixtae]UWQ47444.1 hypothetical protein K3719_08795 [Leisingera aquaemixtae]
MYTVIAIAYRLSTVSVTVSALEAAGFKVFCPWINTMALLPHYSLAFGGVPVSVPAENAAEASEFLRAIHSGHLSPLETEDCEADPPPAVPKNNSLWNKAANLLGYVLFGISAPWAELALSGGKASP